MTKKAVALIGILIIGFMLCSIFCIRDGAQKRDTLVQVSTIDALSGGIYDGETTLNELKQYGDFGLGTFNGLDGEMIAFDGCFYQITSDGKAAQPDINIKTPFAAVTFFEADWKTDLHPGTDLDSLKKQTDRAIPTLNIFYAIRIEGVFEAVRTRSVPKQSKPYQPLEQIVITQPTFDFKNIKGTMVGFRCPPYVKGINVPGYHLHFLTEDGKSGGHVLECTVRKAVLEMDETSRFLMILPENQAFYTAHLTPDIQTELKKTIDTE